jgi:hypothetical protein
MLSSPTGSTSGKAVTRRGLIIPSLSAKVIALLTLALCAAIDMYSLLTLPEGVGTALFCNRRITALRGLSHATCRHRRDSPLSCVQEKHKCRLHCLSTHVAISRQSCRTQDVTTKSSMQARPSPHRMNTAQSSIVVGMQWNVGNSGSYGSQRRGGLTSK